MRANGTWPRGWSEGGDEPRLHAHALVLTLTLIRCRERGVVRTRTRTGQNGWRVDRPRTDLKAERGVLVDALMLVLRVPVHSVARY